MDKVKVKICGITSLEDATMAARLGADALGFIFAPSPRQITPSEAHAIINALPGFVNTVGVFVNAAPDVIRKVIDYCGLDLVQLHGDEPPAVCEALMPRTIKALRVKDESSLQAGRQYRGKVKALLLDAYEAQRVGGTGKTFDWHLALMIKKTGIPVMLAGGLAPANIAAAVDSVRPAWVDVNSGVEVRPGKKSPELIKALMDRLKRAVSVSR